METNLRWNSGASFVGESSSGHRVVIDGPVEGGGRDLGPRPMEMVLLGLGACTGYDVVSILRKAHQGITDCEISVSAKRADEIPQVFTEIHIRYTITGQALSEKQIERAINLSAEKYCSASIMLGKTAKITHSYEIQKSNS